ncbi:metallophosphoesterase [Tenacibaculum sp. TC6]|uniref:metallophosphoesterase n=1 Tax=Tenacibaculum sp. TC6 TaxID=3423223 RepID=UPI003D35F6B7
MKIAIITDIHEDCFSLLKVFKEIENRKIDKVFCLCDIVGFNLEYHHHYLDTIYLLPT